MTYKYLLAAVLLFPALAQTHTLEECHEEVVGTRNIYYGWASCSVYDSVCGFQYLQRYFSSSPTSSVILQEYRYCGTGRWLSCSSYLSNYTTQEITETVCTPIPHNHTTIAIADVDDNDMKVFDSNCSWSPWQGYTHSKLSTLSCNGSQVATVADLEGYPMDGTCTVTIHDQQNYSTPYPGSNTCYITIYRN